LNEMPTSEYENIDRPEIQEIIKGDDLSPPFDLVYDNYLS